jgi:uncharacterized protein YjbI with pentapeptide repeats
MKQQDLSTATTAPGLSKAPLMNFGSSSHRFQDMQQNLRDQVRHGGGKIMQKVALAGGGSVQVEAKPNDLRDTIAKAKQAAPKGRGPLIDMKQHHNADLSKADLRGVTFTGGKMPTNMTGAKADGAVFHQMAGPVMAPGASFKGATFRDVNMDNSGLRGANFTEAKMSGNVSMIGVKAQNANLSGTDLSGARLTNADLGGARLNNTNFTNAEMNSVNLSGAKGSATVEGVKADGMKLTNANVTLSASEAEIKNTDAMHAHIRMTPAMHFRNMQKRTQMFAGGSLSFC